MSETETLFQAKETSNDLSLRDIVVPLIRRKRLLITCFLSSCGALIMLAAIMGPSYTSRMEILVNRDRLDPVVTPESTAQMIATPLPVTEEEINSEVELLSSRDVLEKVVQSTGLARSKGFSLLDLLHPNQTDQDRLARAVKTLAKKLSVKATVKTNLIEVSYTSADSEISYAVLHSLGEFYTQKHVEVHRPPGSYQVFAQEADRYHAALEEAEAKVRDFTRDHHIAAPGEEKTNLALQVVTAIGSMHTTEQAIAADEERIRNDRQQMSVIPRRSPTQEVSATADKLLDDLHASLLAAENKRSQLTLKYEPAYPLVREVDEEIAQIKEAISQADRTRYLSETTDLDPTYEALREELAKSESDRAAQLGTLAATKRAIESMQSQMVDLDGQSLAQQDLLREAKANEGNYLLYLAKREQEKAANLLDTTKVANVAIAVPPAIPVLPNYGWPLIVALAIVAAAMISLFISYTVDYFDPSFRSPSEVADTLGIPVVVTFAKRVA